MTSPTTNKGYTYPAHGGAVNAWDSPLNTNFDQIDQNVGGTYNIIVGSTIVGANYNSSYATFSSTVIQAIPASSIAQNLFYEVSGSGNMLIAFPAVGGLYVLNNLLASGTLTFQTLGSSINTTLSRGVCGAVVARSSYATFAYESFANGTAMLFAQTAAPTGWTKSVANNDVMLRIVSGAVGSGGSWSVSGLTHNHSHTFTTGGPGSELSKAEGSGSNFTVPQPGHVHGGTTASPNTSVVASDATWRPAYVDSIIATKNT